MTIKYRYNNPKPNKMRNRFKRTPCKVISSVGTLGIAYIPQHKPILSLESIIEIYYRPTHSEYVEASEHRKALFQRLNRLKESIRRKAAILALLSEDKLNVNCTKLMIDIGAKLIEKSRYESNVDNKRQTVINFSTL